MFSRDHLEQLPVDLSLFLPNSLQGNKQSALANVIQTATPRTLSRHTQVLVEVEILLVQAHPETLKSSLISRNPTDRNSKPRPEASFWLPAFPFTSSAVLMNRRGVFFGLSRLRRHGPLQEGLWAGLMGKADAWQWWFDFPTKLLDVPLRGEKEEGSFHFTLVSLRDLVSPSIPRTSQGPGYPILVRNQL